MTLISRLNEKKEKEEKHKKLTADFPSAAVERLVDSYENPFTSEQIFLSATPESQTRDSWGMEAGNPVMPALPQMHHPSGQEFAG